MPTRPLPSPRVLLLGLVFLARMWASERRFRRHAWARQHHQVATARHLDGMAAELEFRARLCERCASRVPGYRQPRTASGAPAVALSSLGGKHRL
ncbi:hypothetical protein [Methylobacterium sp. SI9]|uniref:hypothetical protein n=1 Tax=Methylobacterium guangdongense TaxID=3138811 RepID=UPI00313AE0D7